MFTHQGFEAVKSEKDLPYVVVSPHLAWLTPETLDRSLDIAFEHCRRIKDGKPLLHLVLTR